MLFLLLNIFPVCLSWLIVAFHENKDVCPQSKLLTICCYFGCRQSPTWLSGWLALVPLGSFFRYLELILIYLVSNWPLGNFPDNIVLIFLCFILTMQAKCLETGEAVAIKKVLQDKRYKNRELQIMRVLDHPNVVQLKHCFFSTSEKDVVYLNLVLEYVSETVYRVSRHHSRMNQHMPIIYVQLYAYQVNFVVY